jgi:hypothetical protein
MTDMIHIANMPNITNMTGPTIELLAQAVSLRPMAPLWIVGPLAILTMLLLAGHVHLTARICEPESRRRIRMATGMLALTIVPIATAALSIIAPANQRLFAVAWMLVAGLIVIVLLLAFLDMFNTFNIYIAARRELRRTTRETLAKPTKSTDSASPNADRPAAPPSDPPSDSPPPPPAPPPAQ